MIAGMAQWEREEIADRVAASVPIRAKLGKRLGGAAPFGYQWEDKNVVANPKLIPDPKEAPIRRLMYELFQKHQRQRTVARLLNEAGHRTRNGSTFSGNTVLRLIEDPTAKGLHRANYSKSLGEKKHWVFKPEDQWVLQPVEPIISEELWDDCNRILRDQRQKLRPRKRKPVHLFTGFAVCVCGQKLYVPSNTPKYVCYKCRNKIPIGDLEAVFQEQLRNFAVSPQEILSYVEQSDKVIQEKKALLDTLNAEQQKVRQEMNKVYRLYVDDQLDGESFGRLYRPLEERLKQIEDQVPQLEAEVDFLKIQHLSQEQVLSDVQDLCSHWPTLESEEKRNLIEAVLDEVIVGKDDVTFRLNYLPSLEDRAVRIGDPSSSPKLVAEMRRNGRVASQYCHLVLKGPKPKPNGYPKELNTLGDHIRKRRLDLGWFQERVATEIGVDETTICNWETGRAEPFVQNLPSIIRFLGYTPYRHPASFGKWLHQCRTSWGLSQEALANRLDMDESTIAKWERDNSRPIRQSVQRLKAVFNLRPVG